MHPSCHQPDVVHGWLQVAAIETTVSESDIFTSFALCHSGARVYGWLEVAAIGTAVPETDIFACSTSNLTAIGGRFVGKRASVCGYGEDCASALCGALQS